MTDASVNATEPIRTDPNIPVDLVAKLRARAMAEGTRSVHTRLQADSPPPVPPEGAAVIILSKGYYAIVDAADFHGLNMHKWHYSEDVAGYGIATRWRKGGGKIQMHREITGAPMTLKVDHINGDSLDNRRLNLRVCSHAANLHNIGKRRDGTTSEYKGVWLNKRTGHYESAITSEGHTYYIGSKFPNQELAALAYNHKAIEVYGEFAYLNVIPEYTDPWGVPLA